ncbi:MAG: alpha-E domain-containing protein, partial [Pseudomonadota bacterium]
AENIYWIGRYLERAETNAGLLEVGARNALLPDFGGGYRNDWESVLTASGTLAAFSAKYGEAVQRNIESHMFFDRDNSSSVASCLTAARENGRIVRTAITGGVWDALNGAYQEMREMSRRERSQLPLSDLVDWTRRTVSLIRGAASGTMLRNEGAQFLTMGHALERGDSTARLLDVKYYVLLPEVSYVGSGLDNYQWSTLLRAVSSHRSFGWVYGGEVTAAKIADFLILNAQNPRSLRTALQDLCNALDYLESAYGHATEAQVDARRMLAALDSGQVEAIFQEGLHEFLMRYIKELGGLSQTINASYFTGRALA